MMPSELGFLSLSSVMNRRSFLGRVLGVVAAGAGLCGLGTLTGCRASKARTEIIPGEVNKYEIDYSLTPVSWDNPLASSVMSQKESESDRRNEWEQTDPEFSEDPTTDGETAQTEFDELATTGRNATSGGEAQADDGDGAEGAGGSKTGANRTQQGYQPDDDSEEQDGDGEADSDAEEDENPENTYNPGSQSSGGGLGQNKGQTYKDGTYEDIPAVGKIAAVGPYATIVQALGGPGALAACNADWYNGLPSTAFSEGAELADTVKIAEWGDGTRTASASVLQQIIESGAQAVLTSDSYPCITDDDQAAILHEAGISVVVMPVIGVGDALDEGIKTCVSVIGTMLKGLGAGSDGKSPTSRAQEWKNLHDRAISNTVSANGGYTMHQQWYYGNVDEPMLYQGRFAKGIPTTQTSTNRKHTHYIDDWASAKQAVGPSVFVSARNYSDSWWYPYLDSGVGQDGFLSEREHFDEMEQLGVEKGGLMADIRDGCGCHKPYSGLLGDDNAYWLYNYYFQCAGLDDRAFWWVGAESEAGLAYFNSNYFDRPASGAIPTHDHCLNGNPGTGTETAYAVGDEVYPAIIVRDESMAQSIAASRARTNAAQQTIGLYDFGKSYACYVMPRGLDGSWTDGTFESFLMVPWLYCMFWQMTQNGSNVRVALGSCDSYVNEFYQTFYRCSASGILDAGLSDVSTVATNGGARIYGGYASAVAV